MPAILDSVGQAGAAAIFPVSASRKIARSRKGELVFEESRPEELEITGAGGLLRRQPCAKVWLR